MLSRFLHPDECAAIIARAHETGWKEAMFFDGRLRGTSVCFLSVSTPPLRRITGRIAPIAELLGMEVWPDELKDAQISRWRHGQHYDWHMDHDPSGVRLPWDRKLSLYVSLSEEGGLDIDSAGFVKCQTGDALAFASHTLHKRPASDDKTERYSLVAWVPGPRWR